MEQYSTVVVVFCICTYGHKQVALMTNYILWQYGLWSFQTGDTKLERFLHNNQHTKKEIIEF